MASGPLLAIALVALAPAAEPEKTMIELRSGLVAPGLPLLENDKGIYGSRLSARVDKKGEWTGVLELDPNAPAYDEFGFVRAAADLPPIRLECTLKFVKKANVLNPR